MSISPLLAVAEPERGERPVGLRPGRRLGADLPATVLLQYDMSSDFSLRWSMYPVLWVRVGTPAWPAGRMNGVVEPVGLEVHDAAGVDGHLVRLGHRGVRQQAEVGAVAHVPLGRVDGRLAGGRAKVNSSRQAGAPQPGRRRTCPTRCRPESGRRRVGVGSEGRRVGVVSERRRRGSTSTWRGVEDGVRGSSASKLVLCVSRQFECTWAAITFAPTRRDDAGTGTVIRSARAVVVCGAAVA